MEGNVNKEILEWETDNDEYLDDTAFIRGCGVKKLLNACDAMEEVITDKFEDWEIDGCKDSQDDIFR